MAPSSEPAGCTPFESMFSCFTGPKPKSSSKGGLPNSKPEEPYYRTVETVPPPTTTDDQPVVPVPEAHVGEQSEAVASPDDAEVPVEGKEIAEASAEHEAEGFVLDEVENEEIDEEGFQGNDGEDGSQILDEEFHLAEDYHGSIAQSVKSGKSVKSAKSASKSAKASEGVTTLTAYAGHIPHHHPHHPHHHHHQHATDIIAAQFPDIWSRLGVPKQSLPVTILAIVFWPVSLCLLLALHAYKIFTGIAQPQQEHQALPHAHHIHSPHMHAQQAHAHVHEAHEQLLEQASGEMDPRVVKAVADKVQGIVDELLQALGPDDAETMAELTQESLRALETQSMKSAISRRSVRSNAGDSQHLARDSTRSQTVGGGQPLARESVQSHRSTRSVRSVAPSVRSVAPSVRSVAPKEHDAAVALARESIKGLARVSMKLQSRTASIRSNVHPFAPPKAELTSNGSPDKPNTPDKLETVTAIAGTASTVASEAASAQAQLVLERSSAAHKAAGAAVHDAHHAGSTAAHEDKLASSLIAVSNTIRPVEV